MAGGCCEHRSVARGACQAEERFGDTVRHTTGPRERVASDVLGEGANPHGGGEGSRGRVRSDQGGTRHPSVRLVREPAALGDAGWDPGDERGEANPESPAHASRDQGKVEPAVALGAERRPRVLGGGSEDAVARDDEWDRRESADARKVAVLRRRHHRAHGLVGGDRRDDHLGPRGGRGETARIVSRFQEAGGPRLHRLCGDQLMLGRGDCTPRRLAAAI